MKKYGIYLQYGPGTNLRAEGLGRHLGSFLQASLKLNKAKFVIACPAWMKPTLAGVMSEVHLNFDDFEMISPKPKSIFLRIILKMYRILGKFIGNDLPFEKYFKLQGDEIYVLSQLIARRKDILSWYCPALFWPEVNQLKCPVLTCAPDVVLNHFPIGFATNNFSDKNQYLNVVKTIRQGKYFTTYSQDVKNNTLVNLYQIERDNVFVIPHGANRLDNLIDVNNQAQSVKLMAEALAKIDKPDHEMKFIFYASQIRPNKNIMTLLRAYEYLLRAHDLKYTLILTGNPSGHPEILHFIELHHLQNNVLWLHGITAQQLAACYHLAELSVSPTFSEGGFPFTFTESLSVGTPLVMSKINVVEEMITDPTLNEMMLFDPYDWKSMADKIAWALDHKDLLLNSQLPLYKQLSQRTWTHVVADYIDVLDKISQQGEAA
jgi:glycosyltransferase involved in cell wall biosynthesis